MTTPNKPKWIEALEHAEELLTRAGNTSGDERDSLNMLAQSWITVAREYQGNVPRAAL